MTSACDEGVRDHRARASPRCRTSTRRGAAPGQVVVDVERVGVCGTDVEFFTGEMAYLHQGLAGFPMRIGHEWCGTVSAVGPDVDPSWIGRRVTGDTMLGCGQLPALPGRSAARLRGPVRDRHPRRLSRRAGRAARRPGDGAAPAARRRRRHRRGAGRAGRQRAAGGPGGAPVTRGPGAGARPGHHRAAGRAVRAGAGCGGAPDGRARRGRWTSPGRWASRRLVARTSCRTLPWDAVIDASNSPDLPALALDLVEPGKRVVYIGLSGTPSLIDTRTMVLKDVTAVGILSASPRSGGHHRAVRRRCASTRARWSRPPSGSTRSVTCWPAGVQTAPAPDPKIHVDPRR